MMACVQDVRAGLGHGGQGKPGGKDVCNGCFFEDEQRVD